MSGLDEVARLKEKMYALNRKIRSCPGAAPTPQWRALMEQHKDLQIKILAVQSLTQPPSDT